jgi:phenylpropionate dioxygenase-like ring-hydroxylating dioxygenase large terminal subunit
MDIFAADAYSAVRKPLAEASTLPPIVYTSPEWYNREVERIFRKGWLMIARQEELPNPGDYLRVDFAKEPLIVVRGEDGIVRTLSAACKHRGAELASGTGNCGTFICPYHGWTYSLSGELLGAPRMGNIRQFDRSAVRLPSVRTECWGGFICINFDDGAVGLHECLGEFSERFASYRIEEMKIVRKWTYRVNCNWKIWVENSREAYHIGTAHRASLERFRPNGYTLTPFEAHLERGKYAINTGPVSMSFGIAEAPILPFHEGISAFDRAHAHYAIFYPHLILNFLPDKLVYHQIFPDGPDAMTMSYVACYPQSTIDSPGFEQIVEGYYPAAEMAIAEDGVICEAQQRGLGARLATQGRFSAQEEATVHAFAEYILDRMLDD